MTRALTQVRARVAALLHHDLLPDQARSAESTEWCDSTIAVSHFSDLPKVPTYVSAAALANLESKVARATGNLRNFKMYLIRAY
ncbi:hypothetical protein [Stenotrophomonas sp. PFBMAA-4]|uniref:hypothetical protein n=1 Tax=Stenotrophomonas sp. PFBMAA-4 TaxID=3043301 RepID=UPI0024B5B249|nr:hypothetical protein [Stenotrophomonas sp. PFBMAA-4]MDI9273604.1 hypothetical protein [Stenotrophomonas sp. PFBMAA-4]